MSASFERQYRAGTYMPGMLAFWDEVSTRFYRGLQLRRGASLLDVGAGQGTLVRIARVAGVEACGIEPFWPDPIDPNVRRGFAEDLPFPDGSFDTVTCFSVLESVRDPVRALQEMGRVIRGDGRLVVSVPELESYPFLHRARYEQVTSSRWMRTQLRQVPGLRVKDVRGFGLKLFVPLAKRSVMRVLPTVAPRPLAALYARHYPIAVSDLTIWTLVR